MELSVSFCVCHSNHRSQQDLGADLMLGIQKAPEAGTGGMLCNAKLQQSRLLPEHHSAFIPADHSGDSEQVHYQVTLKTNLINKWTEFNPALQCVAALKQGGTASIMVGTTMSFYSSLIRLKYLLLLWSHSLKRIEGFCIYSKVFLSNFSCFKYFSYDILFNLFQVIWI